MFPVCDLPFPGDPSPSTVHHFKKDSGPQGNIPHLSFGKLTISSALSEEAQAFIKSHKSPYTQSTYQRYLVKFFAFMNAHGLNPESFTRIHAQAFIRWIEESHPSPLDSDTVRLITTICSSFFTFLDSKRPGIINPFKGSRPRPFASAVVATIPGDSELDHIIQNSPPLLAAAVITCATTGIKIGSLFSLSILPDKTYSLGEGDTSSEPFPLTALDLIRKAGLSPRSPFKPEFTGLSADVSKATKALAGRLRILCHSLKKAGKLSAIYSFNDLRHKFALDNLDKGVSWIQKRLGYSSLVSTERYLKNTLGVDLVASGGLPS